MDHSQTSAAPASDAATPMGECRRFGGKVALVTASTAGIGLAVARRLAAEGARVVVSSRRQANVDAAVAALRGEGLKAAGTACHVGDAAALQNLVDFTFLTYGRLDVVVSNAAANPEKGSIVSLSEAAIAKILDINIKSAVLLARAAAPRMADGGALVFVSSYSAYAPAPPIAMYAVSKTALLGLTKALAAELAPRLRVNCVAPGVVPTKFAAALVATPAARGASEAATLLGRLGTPADIAAAVAFLASSSDAAYITGETVIVAGGYQSRL